MVSRKRSAAPCLARCCAVSTRGAKTSRSGVAPRARASRRRLPGRGRVAFQQPQHAAGNGGEEPHPRLEDLGRDLVVVVEAAEHECSLGQPQRRPRGRAFGDRARRRVRLVAVGQERDALAVERLVPGADDGGIGDEVVDVGCAHRSRIAEVVDLDGRGPAREDARAAAGGEPLKVDGDVGPEIAQPAGDRVVGMHGDVEEPLHGALDPPAPGVRRGGAVGNRGDLEARAVVPLEDLREEVRGRVVLEVGRQVRHAQPVIRPPRHGSWLRQGRKAVLHEGLRALQAVGEGRGCGDERERVGRRLAGAHALEGRRDRAVEPLPGAETHAQVQAVAVGRGQVGIDRDRLGAGVAGFLEAPHLREDDAREEVPSRTVRLPPEPGLAFPQRLVEAGEPQQDRGPVEPGARVPGVDREGPLDAGERVVEPLRPDERDAAVVQRVDAGGIQRRRVVEGRDRLVEAPEGHQRHAARVVGAGAVAVQDDLPVVAVERLRRPPECQQRLAAIVVGVGIVRLAGERGLVAGERFRQPAEVLEGDAPVVVHRGAGDAERDRAVVAREGFAEPAQPDERIAAVVVGLAVAGVGVDGPAERRLGFLDAFELQEGRPEVVLGRRVARRDPRRLRDQAHGRRGVALLAGPPGRAGAGRPGCPAPRRAPGGRSRRLPRGGPTGAGRWPRRSPPGG